MKMWKKYVNWCEENRKDRRLLVRNNVIATVVMIVVGLVIWIYSLTKMLDEMEKRIKILKEGNEMLRKEKEELAKLNWKTVNGELR